MRITMRRQPVLARLLHRFGRCRRGAALVEFGFVGPAMVVLVLGVLEVGRLAYYQAALNYAAQEATRFAIVREGDVTAAQIEDFAGDQLLGLKKELAVITAAAPISAATNTSLVTVQATYPFRFLLPLPSLDSITLTAESRGFYAFPGATSVPVNP
jgi:Flp pilus assembly protein TadG